MVQVLGRSGQDECAAQIRWVPRLDFEDGYEALASNTATKDLLGFGGTTEGSDLSAILPLIPASLSCSGVGKPGMEGHHSNCLGKTSSIQHTRITTNYCQSPLNVGWHQTTKTKT